MKVLTALVVSCLLSGTLTAAFGQTAAVPAQTPTSPTIAFGLLDGTPIKMRLGRTMSSKDAKTGESVDFELLEDVKVGDVIVANRGGLAMATVTNAHPSGHMGKGGKLDIAIDYLRLVDGERVALRAVKENKGGSHTGAMTGAIVATAIVFFPAAPLFLFMKGKNITIPKGTEITAYVNNDIPLDAKRFGAGVPQTPAAGTQAPEAGEVADAQKSSVPQPEPVPAPVPGNASVAVKSTPQGADIEVDGKFVGNTPSTISLVSGEHKIVIKKKGFTTWERAIMLNAGGNIVIDASLEIEGKP